MGLVRFYELFEPRYNLIVPQLFVLLRPIRRLERKSKRRTQQQLDARLKMRSFRVRLMYKNPTRRFRARFS